MDHHVFVLLIAFYWGGLLFQLLRVSYYLACYVPLYLIAGPHRGEPRGAIRGYRVDSNAGRQAATDRGLHEEDFHRSDQGRSLHRLWISLEFAVVCSRFQWNPTWCALKIMYFWDIKCVNDSLALLRFTQWALSFALRNLTINCTHYVQSTNNDSLKSIEPKNQCDLLSNLKIFLD